MILLEMLFWGALAGLIHTYLIYPRLMRYLARGRPNNEIVYEEGSEWPFVSVIISVYNEESVIREKLESLQQLDYPEDRLSIHVGSDCSSDRTNHIIREFAKGASNLRFYPFDRRRGKPGVINRLAKVALEEHPPGFSHLLLITDANVILSPPALRHLAKHFRNERIAIVDAHMVHTGMQTGGISRAEHRYISSEVLLKHWEGIRWGTMMGPFGGCYALRSTYFVPVPSNFLVDDFYMAMRVFEKGGLAINDLEAICYEAVSHDIREEYRRKARISAGNFQNLFTFPHLWWPPLRPLSFAFFSHKVLRWLGPFLLLTLFTTGACLAWNTNIFYRILFFIMILFAVGFPALDLWLRKRHIHLFPLRGIRYFMIMNAALLEGFINYIKGIESNVWEPPKRN